MAKRVSRERAVAAIVACPTLKEAAGVIGIAEKTLHKWLNEDAGLLEAVKDAQDELTRRALDVVTRSIEGAASTLREIMSDKESPAAVRVSAARTILDNGLKVYDLNTIQRRIERLERDGGVNGA